MIKFEVSPTESERASEWFNNHDCKDPVIKGDPRFPCYPFRSSIGGGLYFCFEPTGLYTSFSVRCTCGEHSPELNDPMDL